MATIQELFDTLEEIEAYSRVLGKVSFDMQCCAPPEGMEQAGRDMAIVGKRLYELTHNDTYQALIIDLYDHRDTLTVPQKALVERLYENYRKVKNQTAEFSFAANQAGNLAYAAWLTAKKENDFSKFRDSLASLIDFERQAIDLREQTYSSYYNACLDDYEKGGNTDQLDAFFGALKERIVPLMKRIVAEGKPIREDFLTRPCPIPEQEAFSRWLLDIQGMRSTATVLMTTEHPFTTNYGPTDVRVTTHYYEENFVSNIFSTLHEGGHALFMQNEPQEWYDNHAANGMSNAMHECISRFYENLVGRSEAFIHFVYPKLQELSHGTFADVSERELYEAVNVARPSLIRTEADELTYSLHVLVRYELEKAFINGDITVDEIPALWNQKYRDYLGVDVPDDACGCLQDVHWAYGNFGYFPSYALGNAYGAQILARMEKELDVYGTMANGDLSPILAWLKENVFSIASVKDPDEWIRTITGEGLNVDYYLTYLEKKYSALYELK
ncbi:MAG: carboxypeptidase M32 [Clostridia bacterium]|nr:carboxypeptidase M32 [Clostridia bacterium]